MNARASLPYNTATEFIAAAKAQPGKFTFGYSTSNTRLAAELFQQRAGVKLLGVPYKSSAAGLADVAGDVLDLFFIDPVSASPFHKGGKVKPLAVGGSQRYKELPQVPTLTEAGVKGYEAVTFIAVYLPAKTPQATVNQFRAAAEQAIKSQTMASFREKAGYQELITCGDDFKTWQAEQINFWRPVIKDAGIVPE
jgi:tripartite-type tricarboxylate transporter receptor subunit TctC